MGAQDWSKVKDLRLLVVACISSPISDVSKNCLRLLVGAGAILHVVVPSQDTCKIRKFFLENLLCPPEYIFEADARDMASVAAELAERLVSFGWKLDGVVCLSDKALPLVGTLSTLLSLPGNSQAAYDAVRDKLYMRKICSDANLDAPRFFPVFSREDLVPAACHVGFPLVVKARVGHEGSTERKCDNMEELRRAFERLELLSINGWHTSDNDCRKSGWIVEQYLQGGEFDIVLVCSRGEVVYSNISDNAPVVGPSFVGNSTRCPSELDFTLQKETMQYAATCVQALGLRSGVFRVTVILTSATESCRRRRPILSEVSLLLSSGHTALCHSLVYGIDLFLCQLLCACGVDLSDISYHPSPLCALAVCDVYASKTGVLLHNRWLDHVKRHPALVTALTYQPVGTTVLGCDTGCPDWLGSVAVSADDPEEAGDLLEAIARTIAPPIVSESELHAQRRASRGRSSFYAENASVGHSALVST